MYDELNILLTENEKKVYLTLLRLGESTAKPILEKTGLQNSVFYRTIHRLIEKGQASYVLKGKIKHFRSTNPDNFLSDLKEKQEKIHKVIPELKGIQKISESKIEAEVFVGVKGIKAMYRILISDSKPNDEYCFFAEKPKYFDESIVKVYLDFRKERLKKELQIYGIYSKELKGKETKAQRLKDKYTSFPLPPNMSIFKDKIAMVTWGETPTGILIKGKDIANQYKKLFDKIWKISKE